MSTVKESLGWRRFSYQFFRNSAQAESLGFSPVSKINTPPRQGFPRQGGVFGSFPTRQNLGFFGVTNGLKCGSPSLVFAIGSQAVKGIDFKPDRTAWLIVVISIQK